MSVSVHVLTVALADTASDSPNDGMLRSLGKSGIVFCPLDELNDPS